MDRLARLRNLPLPEPSMSAVLNKPTQKIQAEYVWVDEESRICSKSKTMEVEPGKEPKLNQEVLDWTCRGPGKSEEDVDVTLNPVAIYADPFRGKPNIIVMCQTFGKSGKPSGCNERYDANRIMEKAKNDEVWTGLEQEYFFCKLVSRSLQGEGESGKNTKESIPIAKIEYQKLEKPDEDLLTEDSEGKKRTMPFYCGIGSTSVWRRNIVEAHYRATLYAGIKIFGVNSEVSPSQNEYQIGEAIGIEQGDMLWVSRYLLHRCAEYEELHVNYEAKPISKWFGNGLHANFSTKAMRNIGGFKNAIKPALEKLKFMHFRHIDQYGSPKRNEERLTGAHETAAIDEFRWGVSDRGASVRILYTNYQDGDGKGYFEDRRPSGDADPYVICKMLVSTCLGIPLKRVLPIGMHAKSRIYIMHEKELAPHVISVLTHHAMEYSKNAEVALDLTSTRKKSDGTVAKHSLRRSLDPINVVVVFLTFSLFKRKRHTAELETFLEMMDMDTDKELIPIFYELSPMECISISRGDHKLSSLREFADGRTKTLLMRIGNMRGVYAKTATGRLSDMEVVLKIMEDVFGKKGEDRFRPSWSTLLPITMQCFIADAQRAPFNAIRNEIMKSRKGLVPEHLFSLYGAKGVGKTTIMQRLANDPKIQKIFHGGIYWLQIGERLGDEELVNTLRRAVKVAGGEKKAQKMATMHVDNAVLEAGDWFRARSSLFMLDNVNQVEDLPLFVRSLHHLAETGSWVLYSTRDNAGLKDVNYTHVFPLEPYSLCAAEIFAGNVNTSKVGLTEQINQEQKADVLRMCAGMPSLLAETGQRIRKGGPNSALQHLEKLREKHLQGSIYARPVELYAGPNDSRPRSREPYNLVRTLERDLTFLNQQNASHDFIYSYREMYYSMLVINEGTQTPTCMLQKLWKLERKEEAIEVAKKLEAYDYVRCLLRHGVVTHISVNSLLLKQYVLGSNSHASNEVWHRRLLKSYADDVIEEDPLVIFGHQHLSWWELENDDYIYRNLARHLARAGLISDLRALLLDYRWIRQKFKVSSLSELASDYQIYIDMRAKSAQRERFEAQGRKSSSPPLPIFTSESDSRSLNDITQSTICNKNSVTAASGPDDLISFSLIRDVISLISKVDVWGEHELPFQLFGRLNDLEKEFQVVKLLLESIAEHATKPWMKPRKQCLSRPRLFLAETIPSTLHKGILINEDGDPSAYWGLQREDVIIKVRHRKLSECRLPNASPDGILAVGRGGSHAVWGTKDNKVVFWDINTGPPTQHTELYKHTSKICALAISDNGDCVVSSSLDCQERHLIKRDKSGDWSKKRVLSGHYKSKVRSIAISGNGSIIATGSEDRTICLWTSSHATLLERLMGHFTEVKAVVLDKKGDLCVSMAEDGDLRVWDCESGTCIHQLPSDSRVCSVIAISPDGSRIISASDNNILRVWDVKDGICIQELAGHSATIRSVTLSDDGNCAFTGAEDNTIRKWSIQETDPVLSCPDQHSGTIKAIQMCSDGDTVVTGSLDKSIRIWNSSNGTCETVHSYQKEVTAVAIRENGDCVDTLQVLSGHSDSAACLWEVTSGELKDTDFREIELAVRANKASLNCTKIQGIGIEDGCIVSTTMAQDYFGQERAVKLASFPHPVAHLVTNMATNNVAVTFGSSFAALEHFGRPLYQDRTFNFTTVPNGNKLESLFSSVDNLKSGLPLDVQACITSAFTETVLKYGEIPLVEDEELMRLAKLNSRSCQTYIECLYRTFALEHGEHKGESCIYDPRNVALLSVVGAAFAKDTRFMSMIQVILKLLTEQGDEEWSWIGHVTLALITRAHELCEDNRRVLDDDSSSFAARIDGVIREKLGNIEHHAFVDWMCRGFIADEPEAKVKMIVSVFDPELSYSDDDSSTPRDIYLLPPNSSPFRLSHIMYLIWRGRAIPSVAVSLTMSNISRMARCGEYDCWAQPSVNEGKAHLILDVPLPMHPLKEDVDGDKALGPTEWRCAYPHMVRFGVRFKDDIQELHTEASDTFSALLDLRVTAILLGGSHFNPRREITATNFLDVTPFEIVRLKKMKGIYFIDREMMPKSRWHMTGASASFAGTGGGITGAREPQPQTDSSAASYRRTPRKIARLSQLKDVLKSKAEEVSSRSPWKRRLSLRRRRDVNNDQSFADFLLDIWIYKWIRSALAYEKLSLVTTNMRYPKTGTYASCLDITLDTSRICPDCANVLICAPTPANNEYAVLEVNELCNFPLILPPEEGGDYDGHHLIFRHCKEWATFLLKRYEGTRVLYLTPFGCARWNDITLEGICQDCVVPGP